MLETCDRVTSMILADLQNPVILDLLPEVEGIDLTDFGEQSEYLRVGEWIALPISHVSCRINDVSDPEILDETGAFLGILCLTSKLTDAMPGTLTQWQYVAYLTDVDRCGAGQPHSFRKNYLVIKASQLDSYVEKYMKTAPLWGGFSHHSVTASLSRNCETITAIPGIIFPTRFHESSFSKYVSSGNAFDRFLRLYHCVELIFDFIFLKSVQKLGNDMVGYAAISRSLGKSELDKLKLILNKFCDDWESIASKFGPLKYFEDKSFAIFQDHTKEGNPLTDPVSWSRIVSACRAGQTTKADFISLKICNSNNNPYENMVAKIASYWIYRVRSSIAHSRVSEFLFEENDENFIVDFVELLLEEVVKQIFSSSELSDLML